MLAQGLVRCPRILSTFPSTFPVDSLKCPRISVALGCFLFSLFPVSFTFLDAPFRCLFLSMCSVPQILCLLARRFSKVESPL